MEYRSQCLVGVRVWTIDHCIWWWGTELRADGLPPLTLLVVCTEVKYNTRSIVLVRRCSGCQLTMTSETEGFVTSPSYPAIYEMKNCPRVIAVPDGQVSKHTLYTKSFEASAVSTHKHNVTHLYLHVDETSTHYLLRCTHHMASIKDLLQGLGPTIDRLGINTNNTSLITPVSRTS